jgi:hypothetical protein
MVYIQLKKSTNPKKKYMAVFYNDERKKIKTIHFGASGMNDYTLTNDNEAKNRYLARHSANEEFNNYMTAGALSRWILWHKPTLSASYNDYIKKFGLTKY